MSSKQTMQIPLRHIAAPLAKDPAQALIAANGDVVIAADEFTVEPACFDALGAAAQRERAAVHGAAGMFLQAQRFGQQPGGAGRRGRVQIDADHRPERAMLAVPASAPASVELVSP